MGKQSARSFKPHEVEGFARQQNRMNNPNVSNIFGSTTTTFGPDDQASIIQELSPQMQGIINSQMDFVGQGPSQLGNFSNPFIESQMQDNANAIARRGGYAPSDASQMGGYSGFNPQFNPQQQELAQALGANPSAPIELENPAAPVIPSGEGGQNDLKSALASALSGVSSSNPYASLGQNLRRRMPDRRMQ